MDRDCEKNNESIEDIFFNIQKLEEKTKKFSNGSKKRAKENEITVVRCELMSTRKNEFKKQILCYGISCFVLNKKKRIVKSLQKSQQCQLQWGWHVLFCHLYMLKVVARIFAIEYEFSLISKYLIGNAAIMNEMFKGSHLQKFTKKQHKIQFVVNLQCVLVLIIVV